MPFYQFERRIITLDQRPWGYPGAVPIRLPVSTGDVLSATTPVAIHISTSDAVYSATTLVAMQISKGEVKSATTAS